MPSESETNVRYLLERNALYRLLNAIIGFFFALLGISAFLSIAVGPPPETGAEVFYVLMLVSAISFMVVALLRNIVVRWAFKKMSRSNFLSLVFFGRMLNLLMTIAILVLFFSGAFGGNATLLDFSFGLFFLYSPIYLMFCGVLLHEGEIAILFELLFSSLHDFVERQRWLRIISERLSNALKLGSIKVSSDNLVFHFNMRLLNGIDIRDSLRTIEAWLTGDQELRFASLEEIIPENEFEPYVKNLLLKQTLKNPTVLKYVLLLAFTVAIIVARPELLKEILDLLAKLVP